MQQHDGVRVGNISVLERLDSSHFSIQHISRNMVYKFFSTSKFVKKNLISNAGVSIFPFLGWKRNDIGNRFISPQPMVSTVIKQISKISRKWEQKNFETKKLINLISRGMYFRIFTCRITNSICTSFWQACVVEELVQKLFVHPPFLNSSHHKNETNLKFSNFKWTPTSFLNYPNLDLVWNSHIDIVKYENFWHNPK